MTPVASFSGLATGIDSAALIESLVQIERAPIRRLENKQLDIGSISKRLGAISGRVSDLQDIAEKLADPDAILVSRASSVDESLVKVSAQDGASQGTFDIEVTQLARAERTYSDTFADTTSTGLFGTGTVSITVGSDTAVDITVDASSTLQTVADAINSSAADVTAGVVFDGATYRLQVSSNETGTDRAVSFTETGTTLGLDDPANEFVSARDAVFIIDTIAMTRSSNSFSDAVPGVTIDLVGETGTGVTTSFKVERDEEAFADLAQEFVDAYNDVASSISAEFVYTGVARTGDSLSGDTMLRTLQSKLSSLAVSPVSGLPDATNRLAAIGISMSQGGRLEMERGDLITAVKANAPGVSELFGGSADASTDGIMDSFYDLGDLYTRAGDGLFVDRMDGLADQVDGISVQIEDMERRIDKFEETQRRRFAQLEMLVSSMNAQGAQMMAMLGSLPTQ